MSLDLFQQEANDRLTALPPVQNVDPGMWDGFIRGTGMATMKGFAKAARAVDLLGAVVPIAQDTFTGGTEAQDKYFAGHDAIFGRAVDYWTPKPQEVGMAGEVMGSLLSVLPQVIVSPSMAVATTQLGTAEDLANVGVTTGKAQAVGAVQALTLGTGIWMPILGANLWQRAVIGGAGFNLVQGTAARAVSGAILADTPAKDMFKAFDAEAMTLDVLMGLAFGGLVHLSPTQRAQGAAAWDKIESWAKNLNPSDKAAIATLREAQHLNVDSTPGKPVGTPDIEAHVERMRAAIDQLATDQPVNVDDITVPRRSADVAEAPPQVKELLEQEQQLRQDWNDAETSRGDAMERGDQEAIALWDKEMQRIAGDLEDVITRRADLWQPEEVDTQPRFEPDPERTAQAEATARDLQAAAETVRAEEGIPPPPQEPPRVVQSVRRTIEEELARAGRPAEEAAAGAAIWDAFYTTMAKRIGTTVDQLWAQFPLPRITNERPGESALRQPTKPILEQTPDGPVLRNDTIGITEPWGIAGNLKNIIRTHTITDPAGKTIGTASLQWDGNEIVGIINVVADVERGGMGEKLLQSILLHNKPDTVISINDIQPSARAFWEKMGVITTTTKGGNIDGKLTRKQYESKRGNIPVRTDKSANRRDSQGGQRGAGDDNRGAPGTPRTGMAKDNGDGSLYQSSRLNTWYKSALGEAITNLNMKQGDAKAWLQALKGLGSKGVKAEEVKWSGIEEWLQLQEGKITKEQVQEFLANNGVKVEEVMLGGAKTKNLGDPQIAGDLEIMRAAGFPPYQNPDDASMLAFLDTKTDDVVLAEDIATWAKEDPELQAAADAAGRIERYWYSGDQNDSSNAMTKYGTYQLPGGENYRELLLTLPQQRIATTVEIRKTGVRWSVFQDGERIQGYSTEEAARIAAKKLESAGIRSVIKEFKSSHFDQPNILAHVRFNERTDAEGKKVLFIEEFQSDWAQKGKRSGFKDPDYQEKMAAAVDEYDRLLSERHRLLREAEAMEDGGPDFDAKIKRAGEIADQLPVLQERMDSMRATSNSGVPAAPFVGKTDAWVALALKRMIAYAAENGFDRVAWTRGEQQVERYTGALRKAVDVIEWTKTDKGVQLVGYKGGRPDQYYYAAADENGFEILDQNGVAVEEGFPTAAEAARRVDQLNAEEGAGQYGQKVVDTTEKEDALSDAIGKAMAEKIISDPNQSGTIEGENIRIDSTGMAGFYDRIVPKVANEVLKKLGGGKVSETSLEIAGTREAIPEFKPFTDEQAEIFQGAENFTNGDKPLVSRVEMIIDGERQPMTVVIDKNGMQMVDDEAEINLMFPVDKEALEVWELGQATALQELERAWNAPEFWRNMMVIVGDAQKVEPVKSAASAQASFDITQSMKDKVEGGLPLFQKTKGTERGYISIGDEGRVIGLLEGADASTFIHESGHFFLDTMAEIGKLPDVPAAVRADLDTALTWMGLKDPAKWVDMTLDEKRPYHEKYARGFEQYLREGKAPSDELKGVFQRFRDWLVELYKSAKSLNVKLNDDIRGVMNRMLADQTRNPSTEAPPAPSVRPGSPPPPGVDGEAQAGAEAQMRAMLQDMALNETGWAQEGGKLLDRNELGTGKPSFTTWIPKAEWWPGRPDKKLNAAKVQEAVRKYLAGEKLKPGEQRTVDYMIDIANARNKGIDTVGGMEEYKALAEEAWDEGLDPTTENVVDLDLVARAAAIDEGYVERAALKYENDDAAFRGELEMLIYETERAQAAEAAGRSKAGEQKKAGSQGAEGQKPTDIVRAEADLIVEKNPDMPITVGVNQDGTPLTMTAREFLDQARAEAELNRADIPLLEVAAQCLLGMS